MQPETLLQSNTIVHWLGPNLESALIMNNSIWYDYVMHYPITIISTVINDLVNP